MIATEQTILINWTYTIKHIKAEDRGYINNIRQCKNITNAKRLAMQSKIEVPRRVRNSESENMTSSGENGLNIRTNASPKWDSTRRPEE